MQILIVKTSSLGDIIHCFPVLEWIKAQWPSALIDWVVEEPFFELVRSHALINQVIPLSTKKWRHAPFSWTTWKEVGQSIKQVKAKRYDCVLDLQGNTKSGVVTFLAKSAHKVGFSFRAAAEWPNALTTQTRHTPPSGQNIREDYLYLAKKALPNGAQHTPCATPLRLLQPSCLERETLALLLPRLRLENTLMVLVAPSSNWGNKQLSERQWQRLLAQFLEKEQAHFFFIWGNDKEKAFAEAIIQPLAPHATLLEKLSLACLQQVMAHVDLVLAVDSLPLHLAGSTDTATYSFFGPSLGDKYRPLGVSQGSFQGVCPYGESFEKRCRYLRSCPTAACLKEVREDVLFEKFYRWFVGRLNDRPKRQK